MNKLIQSTIILFMLFISSPHQLYAADSLQTIARVVWIQGLFTAVSGEQKIRVLKKYSEIYTEDTVMTDAHSTAQIVFTDNSLMTFRQNTSFNLTQYHYDKKDKDNNNFAAKLLTGGFRTITGLIPKSKPSAYAIETPVATIGIRGTDYAVALNESRLFMGLNDSGVPCVTNETGEKCLNKEEPYVEVPTKTTKPIILKKEPEQLRPRLRVDMVTYEELEKQSTQKKTPPKKPTPVPKKPKVEKQRKVGVTKDVHVPEYTSTYPQHEWYPQGPIGPGPIGPVAQPPRHPPKHPPMQPPRPPRSPIKPPIIMDPTTQPASNHPGSGGPVLY